VRVGETPGMVNLTAENAEGAEKSNNKSLIRIELFLFIFSAISASYAVNIPLFSFLLNDLLNSALLLLYYRPSIPRS